MFATQIPTIQKNLHYNIWYSDRNSICVCLQIPLEIVDVETTGYVLRLCPFESLAFSGNSLTDEDLEGFIVVSFFVTNKLVAFGSRFFCLQFSCLAYE